MDDAAFLSALEQVRLAPDRFDHTAHIRAGFLILRDSESFGAALVRVESIIRRFAAAHGEEGRYHETITVAFMALINARMKQQAATDWRSFADANPDLFSPGVLARYYPPGYLARAEARVAFQLPPALAEHAA